MTYLKKSMEILEDCYDDMAIEKLQSTLEKQKKKQEVNQKEKEKKLKLLFSSLDYWLSIRYGAITVNCTARIDIKILDLGPGVPDTWERKGGLLLLNKIIRKDCWSQVEEKVWQTLTEGMRKVRDFLQNREIEPASIKLSIKGHG